MRPMQGKVQKGILVALAVKPMTASELAKHIYGIPAETPSQDSTIRRALRGLVKKGLVQESVMFTRDGMVCWILDKAQIREDPKPRLRSV